MTIPKVTGPASEVNAQIQARLNSFIDEAQDYWIDVREFGAACDDSTDDSAAIQAAIDSVGTTSTTRGGPRILIPDRCAIGSTILINRKSLTFAGLGWGRQGSTGQQSYLRWIGSAGTPMLRLQNAQGIIVKDLHLIGKASAKPSCAISLFYEAGFGVNQNTLENIAIGDLVDGTAIGTGFTDGIAYEGGLASNDTWMMGNILIQGCSGYGIRQSSIQNVNTTINGLTITDSTGGVYAVAAELVGMQWSFGAISGTCVFLARQDDASLNASPNVHVIGWLAERSGRLAEIGGEGRLTIESGHYQTGSFTVADGKVIVSGELGGNGGNARIELKNFTFSEGTGSPTVNPFISIKSTAYANQNFQSLILDGVIGMPTGGPQSNGISAQTMGLLEYKYIYLKTLGETTADYAPFPVSESYLGGVFGGGEVFQAKRIDIPGRLRLAPTSSAFDTNNITAAGNTIVVDRALLLIQNVTGGSLTLTSTPTIANGADGEVVRIVNVGSQNIVLQDQGTLASSNLRLASSTVTLAPRQSLDLVYLSAVGDWVDGRILQDLSGYQPLDSDLTAFAALTPTNDDIVQRKSGAWTNRTMAQLWADLNALNTVTAYTPTITAGAGTFTSVAATGEYQKLQDKLYYVSIDIVITTNGTAATNVKATLPFSTANNSISQTINGAETNNTGKGIAGTMTANSTNINLYFSDSTYPGADGSKIHVEGIYRIA